MDDPLAWATRDADIAYSCPGFDIVTETVELPNGTETDFDYVDEPAAVVVLALTPDDRVVVIEEWREAVGRVNRGLPAGTVEPDDDDLATAARRELEEETGYVADEFDHITTVEPLNGLANSVHHHFVARGCRPAGEQRLDDDESIRVETTTRDELLDGLAAGDLRDGRSALCLLYHERFADD
ncbi:NUDIX hydrolase [Halococcus sp. PRR34]|uniref:NUDIX hydrolase n=1 Tax=Halococcus sp. PRR34 TaxID=3020830 RepID=UPI0023611FFA|nr:NUDIX hydrolase [Halococcus sp. PRR34]